MELMTKSKNKYYETTLEIINDLIVKKQSLTKREFQKRLYDKLEEPDQEKWNSLYEEGSRLFVLEDDIIKPLDDHPVPIRPILLELQWLKYILKEDQINFFLDDDLISKLNLRLKNIEPLIKENNWEKFNLYEYDNKPFSDNIKKLIKAINNNILVDITFNVDFDIKNKTILKKLKMFPYKINYNSHTNSFKAILFNIDSNSTAPDKTIFQIPFENIENLELLEKEPLTNKQIKHYETSIKEAFQKQKENCLILELNPIKYKKNFIERTFQLFACYDKIACYDSKKDKHFIKLYYYDFEEASILKKILSLGPSIIVLEPENIREKLINIYKKNLSL